MYKCGTVYIDQEEVVNRSKRMAKQYRSVDSGDPLYVKVQYIVIYSSTKTSISLTQVREQHKTLNQCYSGQNVQQTRIPKTGKYAFSSSVGVPSIQFLPLNEYNVLDSQVSRVPCGDRKFKSLEEITEFLKTKDTVLDSGLINIIIAPLTTILGQSIVSGNVCTVDSGTVGSEMSMGFLQDFGMGMTLVHELGHVFGLTHIWNTSKNEPIFSDIPVQKYPNYTFKFITNETTGESDATLCNRMRDCQIASGQNQYMLKNKTPPYSYLSLLGCDSTPLFEMGCNFMDYASDYNMAMFTKQQSQVVRATILSKSLNQAQRLGTISTLKKSNLWWRSIEAVTCGTFTGVGIIVSACGMSIPRLFQYRWIWLGTGLGISVISIVVFVTLYLLSRNPPVTPTRAVLNSIRATSISTRSVTFTWDTSVFKTRDLYTVSLNGKLYTSTSPLLTVSDLQPATSYTIEVSEGAEIVKGARMAAMTIVTNPEAPTLVEVVELNSDAVTLTWQTIVGTARAAYNIYQDSLLTSTTETERVRMTKLIPGRKYTFGVSCQTSSGESKQKLLECTTIPLEIQSVSVTNSDPFSIALTYTVPVAGYYDNFKVFVNGVYALTVLPNQLSFILDGLASDTEYEVKMKSVSGGAESAGTMLFGKTMPLVPSVTNLVLTISEEGYYKNYSFHFSTPVQDGTYAYSWFVGTDDPNSLQQKGVVENAIGSTDFTLNMIATTYWITPNSTYAFITIRTIRRNKYNTFISSDPVTLITYDLL